MTRAEAPRLTRRQRLAIDIDIEDLIAGDVSIEALRQYAKMEAAQDAAEATVSNTELAHGGAA